MLNHAWLYITNYVILHRPRCVMSPKRVTHPSLIDLTNLPKIHCSDVAKMKRHG